MNILVIFLACIVNYTNFFVSNTPQTKTNDNAFGIESGFIKYKVEGVKSGSITVIFNKYGDNVYLSSRLFLPDNTAVNSENILKGDSLITIVAKNKTASISKVNNLNLLNSKAFMTRDILNSLGYSKSSQETIMGIKCDKYVGENGEFFIWNNIIIKSEIKLLNTISKMEIVDIKINPSNKSVLFKIPNDYKIIKN